MGEPGVRRWVDTVPAPWRNGGGVTRELASSPAGTEDFDWRISVADVTVSGDFSVFSGVDRTIVLLDGPELILTVGGDRHPLRRHHPFGFDGGLAVSGAVPSGPTRDLNVMTRRGRCRADVTVAGLHPGAAWRVPAALTQVVLPLTGSVNARLPDGRGLVLDRFDLYQPPPGTGLTLTGNGPVAHIEILDTTGALPPTGTPGWQH